jgi:hypothetical protein
MSHMRRYSHLARSGREQEDEYHHIGHPDVGCIYHRTRRRSNIGASPVFLVKEIYSLKGDCI